MIWHKGLCMTFDEIFTEIIDLLQPLCTCPVARHEEVLSFIEANRLIGGASRLHRHTPARLRPARRHLPVDSRPTPQDGCTRSEWDLGWSVTDRMDGWMDGRSLSPPADTQPRGGISYIPSIAYRSPFTTDSARLRAGWGHHAQFPITWVSYRQGPCTFSLPLSVRC